MGSTLDHYNNHAQKYAQVNHTLEAVSVDRENFITQLSKHGLLEGQVRILDAGSGTGRDTLAFIEQGFEVDAFDGSAAMAELSSKLTGQKTEVMTFEAMDLPQGHYDGVWAMASLLHVEKKDLTKTIVDLANALKPGGLLFASFKYGSEMRVSERDGRRFTDLDEVGVEQVIDSVEGLECVGTACRQPPANQTSQNPWFSVIFKRSGQTPVAVRAPIPRKSPKMV